MSRYLLEESVENTAPLPSVLRPRARRLAREFERRCRAHDQALAWSVQDVFIGRGLTQSSYSVSGRTLRIPQVISVTAGPPVGLDIRILPGQIPEDFAANAQRIAYHLGVAAVRVVPLGPSLIRLVLLSAADQAAEAAGVKTEPKISEPAVEPALKAAPLSVA
jgi:hypothetical protein